MHRRADIFSAFECLRAAGFANISMDLIAGLPHQTAASWQRIAGRAPAASAGARIRSTCWKWTRAAAWAARFCTAAAATERARCRTTTPWRLPTNAPASSLAARGIRALRNFQLGAARPALAAQFQVLAARALSRIWRGRAFLRRAAALGQCARSGAVRGGHRAWNAAHRAARGDRRGAGAGRGNVPRAAAARRREHRRDRTAIPRSLWVRASSRWWREAGSERDGARLRLSPSRLTVSNEVFVALLD